jgi:hypothetical protein
LSWTKVPGATPADPPIAIALDQDDLDLLCLVGGIATKWLRTQSNALLLSHVPSHADGLLAALIGLGGLDLDVTYYEKSPLLDAVTAAKLACGDDNRLRLGADAFFEDQPRPAIGSGSSAARNCMYCCSGDMLIGLEDGDTAALGLLRKAVQPCRLSIGRDLAADNYCRVLSSLHNMATSKDKLVESALTDPHTPADEVAEYVADHYNSTQIKTG